MYCSSSANAASPVDVDVKVSITYLRRAGELNLSSTLFVERGFICHLVLNNVTWRNMESPAAPAGDAVAVAAGFGCANLPAGKPIVRTCDSVPDA
eukprot:1210437-Amphidinium_carterae.1